MADRILIADDEPDIRGVLALYLENAGYEVLEAADGGAALELLQGEHIDLCLLDIMMPVLDGYHVLKRIRETSDVPVIVISAKGQDPDKILGLNLGADDYLVKPFNPLEAVARVGATLRRAKGLMARQQAEALVWQSCSVCCGSLVLGSLRLRSTPLRTYAARRHSGWQTSLDGLSRVTRIESRGCKSGRRLAGEGAGGGLTASLCLLARDRGEVAVAYQMPLYPMIDNLDTASSADNHNKIWNTRRNHQAWWLYLRKDAQSPQVSPYAAAARATDLAGLPPAYTFVCTGEPFYAETLAYVEALRFAGVPAEVDVYEDLYHAFDMMEPDLPESQLARQRFCEHFERACATCFAPQG